MFQTALYSATEFAYRADCLLLDHTRRAGTPRIPRVPGARLNPQSPVGRDPTALQRMGFDSREAAGGHPAIPY